MFKLKNLFSFTIISALVLSFLPINLLANSPIQAVPIASESIDIIDTAPRIMSSYGKVNQHFDINKGAWLSDPDGVSGADLDKLTYCQKFYPNTVRVREYKEEMIDNWENRGNSNLDRPISSSTAKKAMSYLCIQGEQTAENDNQVINNKPQITYINTITGTDHALVKWISKDEDKSYISYYKTTTPILSSSNSAVACTMDAKACPDGSFVSRIAPDCNFAACPDEVVETIVQDDTLTTTHGLKLTNLEPNSIYHFKIHSFVGSEEEEVSRVHRFKTLSDQPTDKPDYQIYNIRESANFLSQGKSDEILSELKQLRNRVKEQEVEIKYLKNLNQDLKKVSNNMKTALNEFITYGVDENTLKLGEGERAAVIHSYKQAYDKLPDTEEELEDAIKIANGRFPTITNQGAEDRAKEEFKKIYKRRADLNNERDRNAITVMAYGLRQKAENRNLNSEKRGIEIFQSIYNKHPQNTQDWNIMQAITYSGASR
jgi:hypothetical protein